MICDGGIVQRARPTKNCPHREGYFQIGDQCKEYKFCQNGYARVYRCGRGMLFNFDIPACDFEQNVHCGGDGDYSAEIEDRQNVIPKLAPRPKALPIAPKSPALGEKESLAPVTAAPRQIIRTQSPLGPATPRPIIRTQSPRQTTTTAAPTTTTEVPTTTLPTTTIPVTRRIVSNNNLDEEYHDEPDVEY